MLALWSCLLLVLGFLSLHQRSEAVPKRDVDQAFLAYSLEFDNCKDITDSSPRDSKKAVDDACEQAFFALHRIKQNTCQNWRHAKCRLISGQTSRQCSCLVSYYNDSQFIPTLFRVCAKNIVSAGPSTTVELSQSKKRRESTHEDIQKSAKKQHVPTNIEPYGGVGTSYSPYTSGGGDNSEGEPIGRGAGGSGSVQTSGGAASREHDKDIGPFPWTIGPQNFQNLRSLNTHMKSHNPNETTCPVCHGIFSRRYTLKKHIERAHPWTSLPEKARSTLPDGSVVAGVPALYPCPHCPRSYVYKRNLRQHMKSHNGDETKCPFCHETFALKLNLKAHIEFSHPETLLPEKAQPKPKESGPFICKECGSEYTTEKILRRHEKSHDTLDTHCFECKQTCATRASYIRHLKIFHPEDALAVKDAEKERYIAENPKECGICKKRFKTRDGLQLHRKTHQGKTTCEFCGQVFTRVNTLNTHKSKAHPNEIQPK